MNYLQLLDTIRSVTGRRRFDRFPAIQPPVTVFRRDGDGPSTFVVVDAAQAKAVMQSPRYRQFDFLAQVLTIAKPDRTRWIRRFCDIGLIMMDGPEHERRRRSMQRSLDRCAAGVRAISADDMMAVVEEGLAAESCTSATVAARLVTLLFSRAIAVITGKPVELPVRDLLAIDFFRPFPTLSSLAACDESIDRCCRSIDLESLDEGDQAAVLSLLVMGVSPMHALLTTLVNVYATARREGLTAGDAAKRTAGFDATTIVPTNFVMRACVGADTLGGEAVEPGDVVYLFLGSASGCPFSRLTSLPFGAGSHYCSGAALTQLMLKSVRSVLGQMRADCSRISSTPEVEGKASAFLVFATES